MEFPSIRAIMRRTRAAADEAAENARTLSRSGNDPMAANNACRAADLAHQAAILAVDCPERARELARAAELAASISRDEPSDARALIARRKAGPCQTAFYVNGHKMICATAGGEFHLCVPCQDFVKELTE